MTDQCYVSDELTHFVGRALSSNAERYALFLKVLGDRVNDHNPRTGWLQASYREEFGPGVVARSDGRLRLSTNKAVRCTMLCFCDIPPSQLSVHMHKYGHFGIAFPKQFLLRRGTTPVYYVARNAINQSIGRGGPKSLGERFDELRAGMQQLRFDLEQYVSRIDGTPSYLSKLSSPTTPSGHRLLGRFSALESEIEDIVFARTKFFTEGLPADHPEHYYMEREWRLPDGLSFRLGDISRIILPRDYCERFRLDVPEYNSAVLGVKSTDPT